MKRKYQRYYVKERIVFPSNFVNTRAVNQW